ncbi:MAG: 3-oxoacyl-[acyl-carrier-protein] reductase [Alphaproteobacteria bacterium]|nr:3-oxoacyl-[acyl-carrier-protein] reductase [Alphaproteobacteria bacterium]
MFNLEGKNALITGATGGIGSAIATALYNQGAKVLLTGTKEDRLKSLAADLGERASQIRCDLSDEAQVGTLIKDATEIMGSVDILICNAGITRDTLTMRMSNEMFDEVININLRTAFILNRDVIRGMMRSKWGRIINISSIVGHVGNPGQANYCASKAGLAGMSRSISQEVASRGVTVNCIAPGFISTPMTESLNEMQKAQLLIKIPNGAMGEPSDIGYAALYLASNESKYVTGQTIHVNGGMFNS